MQKIIILEKKYGNKYDDIMYRIATDDELVEESRWGYDEIMFGYDETDAEECNLAEYLKYIDTKMKEMDTSSREFQNLYKFMETRNFYEYGMELRDEFDLVFHNGVLDKVVEILSDKETRDKFIDYSNNKEMFYVKYEENQGIYAPSMNKDIFMKIMLSMFGTPDNNGEIDNNRLYSQFYIPGIEEYKKAYLELYDVLNFKQYIPKYYRFTREYISDEIALIVDSNEEPEWAINEMVIQAINNGMPNNLSTEEKAIYVYYKMCEIFSYDEGYMYRYKMPKVNYTSEFSKSHLEGIIPGDKITCYDFSRIYAKYINNMEEEIDCVMISVGINNGHYYIGVSTKKGAVELDAVNGSISEENGDVENDILRAKLNKKLSRIKTVHGQNEVFENANQKIYELFQKQQEKSEIDVLLEKIKLAPDEELPQNFEQQAKSLITNMKKIGISGNEFSMVFNNILHKGFFGDNLECAYIGTVEETENKEKRYKRIICVCQKENEEFKFYLIDTKTLELTKSSEEEIRDKLASQEFVYENEERTITVIER